MADESIFNLEEDAGTAEAAARFFALGFDAGEAFRRGFQEALEGLPLPGAEGEYTVRHEHAGAIELRGVTNSGEFVDASSVLISELRSDARWR